MGTLTRRGQDIGQHLGRYELLVELARGGMAELFLARLHGAAGFTRLVAIKRILPHLAGDPQFKQMFLDEGHIAARLSHTNICQVFELAEEEGELFLAMEYLHGVSWEHLLSSVPRELVPPLAGAVLVQAAEGLHHAHCLRDLDDTTPLPVIHRDVSPQNLMITVDGVCKVLDFGVSKMMTDGPRTKSGVIKGKLPYMAPEQIRGEPVDARTDVFSLGVCAWEALAGPGARLFHRATDFLIWRAITEEPIPSLTDPAHWPACPPALADLVARALSRDPAGRPPTARAFADELRAALPSSTTADLADAVRTWCAPQIAARAAQIASATRPVPAVALDPSSSAAETLLAPSDDSMLLRQRSIALPRASDPDAAATVDQLSRARRASSSELLPARHRSVWWPVLGASVLAAALTAVIVVVVTGQRGPAGPAGSAAPSVTPDAGHPAAAAPSVGSDAGQPAPAAPSVGSDTGPRAPARPSVTPDTGHRTADRGAKKLGSGGESTTTAASGTFSVRSRPYATIFADGVSLGDTPLYKAQLRVGAHHIRAVLPDGRERTFDITVRAGEDTSAGTLEW